MHNGSCLCGSIRYAIDDHLKFVVNCHCRFCSKAHGAAFTTLLFMPFAKFELLAGKELLAGYEVKTLGSSRCFCSSCGTRLYNYSPSRGMISLIAATLDDNPALRPLAHFNVESRRSWHTISDGLPQFQSTPTQAEFAQLRSG